MTENLSKNILWEAINCLVVDDDKFSRTFMKTALYQIGIKNVREAVDVDEAREILADFKIDVILLDQLISGVDAGFAAADDGHVVSHVHLGCLLMAVSAAGENSGCGRSMSIIPYLSGKSYIDKYREKCFVVGKRVTVVSGDKKEEALVLGIDDGFKLLVRYDDGREDRLSSGEISIRL